MVPKIGVFLFLCACLFCALANAQPYDPLNFDETAEGPWSDIQKTTLTIPKVADGQVKLDGVVSSNEYGGFQSVGVIPGETAWILNYAEAKDWKSVADTSFSFYLAYDNDNLYIGVDVKDDVVRSNDPPAQFWKDDAVEILIDPLNTRYDYNYDSNPPFFGGHIYFNWEGKFSNWENDARIEPVRWSSLADWSYGADKEVYGFGKQTATGWMMEMRFHKVTLIDPLTDFKWQQGTTIAFNIGLDDDDGENLALQYWWANRIRAIGANPDNADWYYFTDEELANKAWLDPNITIYPLGIDANGRLTAAGAGEAILGPMGTTAVSEWSLF